MKLRMLNERPKWSFWVPDFIADWDAPSHWERERLDSMQAHLKQGDVLYDIGVEHGWQSAMYGSFVGYENMVLVEPSPVFWPNIRRVWELNKFPTPLATFCAYVGDALSGDPRSGPPWPPESDGPECNTFAYRSLLHDQHLTDVPTITVDWIANFYDDPAALTIDVEGAELLVLWGAEEVLREVRPLVWVSIHPDLMERDFGHHESMLHEFMAGCGYRAEFIAYDHEAHWLFLPEF